MNVGTKSLLFGVHQVLIHPWFVAWAWWELFGFPWDPRLWVAFFVHDWGYWGKPNMDGPEGEVHPWTGAKIMTTLFDWPRWKHDTQHNWVVCFDPNTQKDFLAGPWGQFAFYHSRFLAKSNGMPFSKLCLADKYSFVVTPKWLYLPLARATGEIREYMKLAEKREAEGEPRVMTCSHCGKEHVFPMSHYEGMESLFRAMDGYNPFITCVYCGHKMPVILDRKYSSMNVDTTTEERWWEDVRNYIAKWVGEHKDMRPDTWTPDPDKNREQRQAQTSSGVWE